MKYKFLAAAFKSAAAVDEFSDIVRTVRLDVDQAVGISGSDTKPIDEDTLEALKVIVKKYNQYITSFDDSEKEIKKKVETDLGWQLLQLKQRVGYIGQDWGQV